MSSAFHNFFSKSRLKRGFTMIELLVVIAIFAIMAAILLANYRSFGTNITLDSIASETALAFRQAQNYSLATQEFGTGDFDRSYGVYLNSATPGSFKIFADHASAGTPEKYDSTEDYRTVDVRSGFRIHSFCAVTSGSASCGSVASPNTLNVVFPKGKPSALIKTGSATTDADYATVCIMSPESTYKKIKITKSGQVAILDTDITAANLNTQCVTSP